MPEQFHIVPESQHNALVAAAYQHRGFHADEAAEGARFCAEASRHGIRTHNGIKALHLDHLFGSGSKGCVPGAQIEEKSSRFAATKIWNANKKLGQSTAYRAMAEAIRLADQYGVGTVSVDNAFHYLWGGGYVMDAANERLHRSVHQLHRGTRRSRAFRRKISDARDKPALRGDSRPPMQLATQS